MRISRLLSAALFGVEAYRVEVEVHIARGIPSFDIVGLPESSVKEGRKRIRSAILSSGFEFPTGKIIVNLAPADLKKQGARFDLPIAIGILTASGQLVAEGLERRMFIGELALDGRIRACTGGLATAKLCRDLALDALHLPIGSARFLDLIALRSVVLASSLADEAQALAGFARPDSQSGLSPVVIERETPVHLSEICGQHFAKRALVIAAAGFHSVIMVGPPGAGKSLLARSLTGLLPKLNRAEAIEVATIYSMQLEHLQREDRALVRPFRSPNHTASVAGFMGRKQGVLPGEFALAHRGVLFLDELPEFRRDIIESLREPMEDGSYQLSRAWGEVRYPSRFMLIAAMNPCPCGFFGDAERDCRCVSQSVDRYRNKVSAPILDRIDLHVPVKRVSYDKPPKDNQQLSQADLVATVEAAMRKQRLRYSDESFSFNSEIPHKKLTTYCKLTPTIERRFHAALEKLKLSYRAKHRILRVARTIADLQASDSVTYQHLLEALQYQRRDITAC